MFFPVPDPLDEGVAADVVAGLAVGVELSLHQHLGGDARVVGAHLPEGAVALHAVVADQRVHQRVLKSMAHVQAAGDVRRRNDDGKSCTVPGWGEVVGVLPLRVELLLDCVRVETILHARLRRADHL